MNKSIDNEGLHEFEKEEWEEIDPDEQLRPMDSDDPNDYIIN